MIATLSIAFVVLLPLSGMHQNTSFREKALVRGKSVYTMLEPRLVRPRFPTNEDMQNQRNLVAEMLAETEEQWKVGSKKWAEHLGRGFQQTTYTNTMLAGTRGAT